jgi:caffeoyl-CoA O-methyltransferase
VTTCEIDETSAALARRYFAMSPHGHKITIRMGPAIETMRSPDHRYDVIFIDADKQNYVNYYRRAKELLSPDGVILIDNVLWDGDVLLQPPPDERTAAIQELNRIVRSDADVSAVLLTIRDGLFLVRKNG